MKALTEKFVCCAIFSNMLACLQGERLDIAFYNLSLHSAGNQTANYFGVTVPRLQDYMSFM